MYKVYKLHYDLCSYRDPQKLYIYNGRLKLHRRNKGEKSNLNEQAYKLITQK